MRPRCMRLHQAHFEWLTQIKKFDLTISYFDGLVVDHADCKSAAELVAEVLQGKPVKLDRVNRKLQDACECGFRAAYWAEEMCRRQRGEGSWTFAYSVADRADKVQKVVSQLKKHRSSVQSQVIRRV